MLFFINRWWENTAWPISVTRARAKGRITAYSSTPSGLVYLRTSTRQWVACCDKDTFHYLADKGNNVLAFICSAIKTSYNIVNESKQEVNAALTVWKWKNNCFSWIEAKIIKLYFTSQSRLQIYDLTSSVLCFPSDVPEGGFPNSIPMVMRGNCTFYDKVRLAQINGAKGLLIVSKDRLVRWKHTAFLK